MEYRVRLIYSSRASRKISWALGTNTNHQKGAHTVGLVHRPLFHLLISFCGGIFIGRYLSPVHVIFCFILTAFFSALLFFFLVQGRKSSFLPLLVFILSGALASSTIPDPDQPPGDIQQLLKKKNVILTGTITHLLQRGPTRSRMLLNLASFKEGDGWRSVSGNLLLNIRNCQRQWPVGQTLAGRVTRSVSA